MASDKRQARVCERQRDAEPVRKSGAAARMLHLIVEAGLEPHAHDGRADVRHLRRCIQIVAALDELREAGVGVALDDFGMATSLADLKRLPIDQVKLAREFVGAINGPAEDSAFALSLINIADVAALTSSPRASNPGSRRGAWPSLVVDTGRATSSASRWGRAACSRC